MFEGRIREVLLYSLSSIGMVATLTLYKEKNLFLQNRPETAHLGSSPDLHVIQLHNKYYAIVLPYTCTYVCIYIIYHFTYTVSLYAHVL